MSFGTPPRLSTTRGTSSRYPDAIALDGVYRDFEGRGKIYPEETKRYHVYRKHIQKFPNRTSDLAMVALGRAYIAAGQLDSAKNALGKVVERHPQGQYCAEDKAASIAVFHDPDRALAQALWGLAEVERRRGDRAEEQRLLGKLADFYPASTLGVRSLSLLVDYELRDRHEDSAKKLISQRLDILRHLLETAEKCGLPSRSSEYRKAGEEAEKLLQEAKGKEP